MAADDDDNDVNGNGTTGNERNGRRDMTTMATTMTA
jgi:hypothetical protein